MIKQLITDIAFDNIKLSQAITRAKLVENKIKNDTFKQWLKKELEGYDYNDTFLPEYRRVWSVINLIAELPYGRTETFPVILDKTFDEKIIDTVNYHRIIEPIAIVEQQIENIDNVKGYITIPPQMVRMLADVYNDHMAQYDGVIKNGRREVGKIHYQNVLEQTKQKLLDTLMELESEFPDLLNDYTMTKENNEKVQNIITNNIYGDNNPVNVAAGINVEQNISNTISNEDEKKLKGYGVEQKDIDELKKIIETSADKPSLGSKAMKWLGGVSASVAAKGLYENIPNIIEFTNTLIK